MINTPPNGPARITVKTVSSTNYYQHKNILYDELIVITSVNHKLCPGYWPRNLIVIQRRRKKQDGAHL